LFEIVWKYPKAYLFTFFTFLYTASYDVVRVDNVIYKIIDIIVYFYTLDTFEEITDGCFLKFLEKPLKI